VFLLRAILEPVQRAQGIIRRARQPAARTLGMIHFRLEAVSEKSLK